MGRNYGNGADAMRYVNSPKNYLLAVTWAISAAVAQIALASVVPGGTIGTPLLQRDTMNQLLFMDRAFDADCKNRKIVNTEVLERPKDSQVSRGRLVGGSWKERWSVDRCGTVVTYDVQYTADGKGGTFIAFNVARDADEVTVPEPTGFNAALLQAAEAGDTNRLQDLLAKGADLDTRDQHGRNSLMIAAVEGNPAAVALLLEKGADVASRNKYGVTALHLAVGKGQAEVTRTLLAHGADANEKSGQLEEPPVISAAVSGSIETVEALLEAGANLNEADTFGGTALIQAARNGRSEMVLFLLNKGADGEIRNKAGKKALGSLGTRCISVEAAHALNARGGYEQAEIQEALFGLVTGPTSCLELVKFVIENGAKVNGQDDYGNTALIVSSMWGHVEVARYLLSSGADVRLKNRDGAAAADVAGDSRMRKLLKNAKR